MSRADGLHTGCEYSDDLSRSFNNSLSLLSAAVGRSMSVSNNAAVPIGDTNRAAGDQKDYRMPMLCIIVGKLRADSERHTVMKRFNLPQTTETEILNIAREYRLNKLPFLKTFIFVGRDFRANPELWTKRGWRWYLCYKPPPELARFEQSYGIVADFSDVVFDTAVDCEYSAVSAQLCECVRRSRRNSECVVREHGVIFYESPDK